MTTEQARRNGTGAPMPIKETTIQCDDIGYPGWHVSMRTNPRSSLFDRFLSQEPGEFWDAFAQLVLEWNFADEDGRPLPLPSAGTSYADLPRDLVFFVIERYIDEFNATATPPKARAGNSAPTSSTSDVITSAGVG